MSRTLAARVPLGKSARIFTRFPFPLAPRLAAAALAGFLLCTLPAAAGSLTAQDLAVYRQAFKAADNDRLDEALEIAGQARDKLPAKILRWMALATPGGGSFDEIAAFIRENGDWPNQAQLRRQAEKAMPIDLDEDKVLAWFKQYPPLSNEGFMRYADTLMATGNAERAVKMARDRWVEASFSAADEEEFLARYRSHLRPQDHKARIDRLLWEKQEAAVRRMLPFFDDAYDRLIEARIALDGDARNADAALAKVPDSLRNDPGLLFDRARYRRRKGDDAGALEIITQAPKDMGRPQAWWTERHILARRAIEKGDYNLAYRLVKAHGQTEGNGVAEAEFLAGFLALRFLDDPSSAFGHFHKLYRSVGAPISKARGAYWCGRAAEALGETAQAKDWYAKAAQYGTTFYGQLAARHTGSNGRIALPAEPRVSNAEATAFERREVVRATKLLAEIEGKDDERVTAFLRRISLDSKDPSSYVLAAKLAREVGRRDLAVAAAKDAAQSDVFLVEAGYPMIEARPSAPEIALVHAIIRQESTFSTGVVSSAGARGLMQLMPGTAQLVATKLGIKHNNAKLTADPEYNVKLGSAYLADMIDRFNGSYIMAIAAYNAGPTRVRQWIDSYGDPRGEAIDPVDWLELIPIYETRNYVQRVMEAMLVYRARIQGAKADLNLDRELRR
ncbi:lytic transglycosylase domain-containing protein [Azospirillum rugosum]|uniref:Soluble lytic murein transglycosylase n=1 Tax=Azospirillum rugosum TaxID=416170 RepID=A0ABS4SQE8_9PROT|nr:lytic transglycosylase domain-containing protein [Azospirillum rugosum]MBP2294672.1 soluble lytic murein transglycosylase [Azospirillum rugosum]MDQ0528039.1 soluble lytic murein transglycosylase [Azospirillum rugosum]